MNRLFDYRRLARHRGRDVTQRPRPLELRPLVGRFGLWLSALSLLILRLHAIVPSFKNRSWHNRKR
jgi:hypothetical protein